jgi:hypothetical protein
MVRRFLALLILLALVPVACASLNLATPDNSGTAQFVATPATSIVVSPAITIEITPTSDNCAFVWASQELPDLSQKVAQALQAVDPNITGSAYAYGENCVYGDGHSTFGAMETDFRVKITVQDIKDENSLGNWIARGMDVITKLPPDQLSGPQPGRVEFAFTKSESEILYLNVSIANYRKQPPGLTGIELYRILKNNP